MRAEAYPELKAGENFLMLQRSLNEVEEQISASRRAYNASVENLNMSTSVLRSMTPKLLKVSPVSAVAVLKALPWSSAL